MYRASYLAGSRDTAEPSAAHLKVVTWGWVLGAVQGHRCPSLLPALQGHVMDRRKKALTDYKKLRTFFVEEEERFLQEAEKEEGSPEDEDADPAERFRSLLQALSDLERRHRNLGLSMLLQVSPHPIPWAGCRGSYQERA